MLKEATVRGRLRTLVLVAAVAAVAPAALAQQPAASPVADALRRAERAFNDADYERAISDTRSLLSLSQLSRADRISTLMLASAAFYPEDDEAPARQQPDSAAMMLRRLVRLAPTVTMPRTLTWRGLDSLLEHTRRTTFAALATPRRDNTLAGSEGSIPIAVVASRPARFYLALGAPQSWREGVVDFSGPARDATLNLRLFRNDQLLAASGETVLTVVAVDSANPDTLVQSFPVTINARPLGLSAVPTAVDSTLLRSEWAAPNRGAGFLIGAALGGATVLLAQTTRGDDPVGSSVDSDNRAMMISVGFLVGGVIGAFLDKGKPLPRNVAHNGQLRAEFDQRVATTRAGNERLRSDYRATITIGEALP